MSSIDTEPAALVADLDAPPTGALTLPEVAAYLRLPESTTRGLLVDGIIPAYKAGRAWRVDAPDLIKWKTNAKRRAARGGKP